jgi:hypothetical protein
VRADSLKKRLDVVDAVIDLLKRLRLRPPSQIQFRTIANTPTTASFSKHELLNALYALEHEGVIALHHDNSFSVLKSSTSI